MLITLYGPKYGYECPTQSVRCMLTCTVCHLVCLCCGECARQTQACSHAPCSTRQPNSLGLMSASPESGASGSRTMPLCSNNALAPLLFRSALSSTCSTRWVAHSTASRSSSVECVPTLIQTARQTSRSCVMQFCLAALTRRLGMCVCMRVCPHHHLCHDCKILLLHHIRMDLRRSHPTQCRPRRCEKVNAAGDHGGHEQRGGSGGKDRGPHEEWQTRSEESAHFIWRTHAVVAVVEKRLHCRGCCCKA